MSDFFWLRKAGILEIGEYPQIVASEARGRLDLLSLESLPECGRGAIKEDAKFPVLIMGPMARMTDLLSSKPTEDKMLIISPRTLDLVSRFHIDEYQCFPVTVSQGEQLHDYYAIRFIHARANEFVNWNEATFCVLNRASGFDEEVFDRMELKKFGNYEMYARFAQMEGEKSLVVGMETEIVNTTPWDMFCCEHPLWGFYFSDILANAIMDNGLTGFYLKQLPRRFVRVYHSGHFPGCI